MGDLNPLEKRLVRYAEDGVMLDLTDGQDDTSEAEMIAWGADRGVRASVIRDILRGKVSLDSDPHGIRLRGARIIGHLDLAHITAAIPLELRNCYLASGADLSHAVLKSVNLSDCRLSHLKLRDSHVAGQLNASGAVIGNDAGTALNADGLRVFGDLILTGGFTVTGAGESGAVRLLGARISGQLAAKDARISNNTGPAFAADGLQLDGDLFLDGFIAIGAGECGAVRFPGARVGGQVSATGATISNKTGAALAADRLRVGGSLLLRERFTATGAGERGAVVVLGADVGGRLDMTGATISNSTGPAVNADGLQVAEDLLLIKGFTATSGDGHPAIELTGARLGGLSLDVVGIQDFSGSIGTIVVDGLVYGGLPEGPTVADWLSVLADRTPSYKAQPYQQLAAATRAAGHDGDTRKVLMAQRRDQIRRRAVSALSERTWARATGILLGYGYQPWRALIYLFAVLAAAISLAIVAGGHHGGLAHTSRTTTPNSACTTVEQIGVGIDLGLPLIKTTARETCTTTATTAGQTITAAGWTLQALAWALATLFIAGFTGAVRKT
ncbi:hypothetical protein [Kribbella sp. NPDC023855]|uniref:hypothetical protein n=1 Tax=Kribbella sp. NPDC023855 TaxID=3154698 RepID=UPI0033CD961E